MSHSYETCAAVAKKTAAEAERVGNASKMATSKTATLTAVQAMAKAFTSLQKDVGQSQVPTPSQIRAASAECARRASLAARSGQESPWTVRHKRLGKKLMVFVDTCLPTSNTPPPPTPRAKSTNVVGRLENIQGQGHTSLYGRYKGMQEELIVGNIADQQVQAVVSAANGELKPTGGVAAALSKRGGALYDRIVKMALQGRGRSVPAMKCCVTAGGELPARTVIHAVGVQADDYEDEAALRMDTMQAVYSALNTATELGLKEVALPAIGAGAFGVPLPVAARAAADALLSMTKDNIPTGVPGLKVVRWVLSSKEAIREFAAAFSEVGLVMKNRPITPRSKLAPRLSVLDSDEASTDEFCNEVGSKKAPTNDSATGNESKGPVRGRVRWK
jgi:O-acetyl-ADP-ribose deacetylase (regulator of RNase III)